jgi:hypothetical protein
MHLAYVDDSGDSRTLVLAALLIPADGWLAVHDHLVRFRSRLSKETGFRMRKELKATEVLSDGGAWRKLNPRVPLRRRFGIYKAALNHVAELAPQVRAVGVVIPNRKDERLQVAARAEAWDKLLERFRTFCSHSSTTCLIVPDEGSEGGLKAMARRKRRFGYAPAAFGGPALPVPFVQLLDDPMPKDSKESYIMQWTDLVAYAAFRQIMPFPTVPERLWDELGDARLSEANHIERTWKGSLEPPGLVVLPSRMKPGSQL